ncbi:MAG TPA: DinB family protein [Tepidiformaceae bacterium]|nr:DinB family protein [Tepidiformaceae bacterium]
MFTSIETFLRYFDGVNRRAMRDVAALPEQADGWKPATGEGERAWSINTLVGHMCGSRLYFASAYAGNGWVTPEPPDVSSRDKWVPALERSAVALREKLAATPDDWLERRIPMIDSDGSLAGWRLLLMMMEHDIHHRSQIDTYAGINGWDVPQIYNRTAETIGSLQPAERAKHGLSGDGHPI